MSVRLSNIRAGLAGTDIPVGLTGSGLAGPCNAVYTPFRDPLADDSELSKVNLACYAALDFASGFSRLFSATWFMSIPDLLTGSLRIYLILPICKDYLRKSLAFLGLGVLDVTKPFLGTKNITYNDLGEITGGIELAAEDLSKLSEEHENKKLNDN